MFSDTPPDDSPPYCRTQLLTWAVCCVLAGAVLVIYALTSLTYGRGAFVLPLDDVYIHFQYARQLANGQPFIYNPGDLPTSGATSLLYPLVLAAGYGLGFQGLNLSLWAMSVGALALAGAMWVVYRLVLAFAAHRWLAWLMMVAFGLSGPVSWHFMSGMETGLAVLALLLTLWMIVQGRVWGFVVSASLLALLRPEGSVLAIIAAVVLLAQAWVEGKLSRRWMLLIPVLMVLVQPGVNWLVTGSAVATGNSAKSILGTVPFIWENVLLRIAENFAWLWLEFLSGYSGREGWYVPVLLVLLGSVSLLWLLHRREQRHIGMIVVLWLLAGTALIATLDTAFWHFKRYQMPLLALFFPLSGWALAWLHEWLQERRKWLVMLYAGVIVPVFTVLTAAIFWQAFGLNVGYVYAQPLQMARWLEANTSEDAVIAVHDVGMMRYLGGRMTLDMVGLTTPGAADYWRNGPGSVAEFLIAHRPDYIASYGHGHGYGLGMLADTSLYGEPLVGFPVMLDPYYNVALAADFQGIYQPDWRLILDANPFLRNMPLVEGAQVVNVANLASEEASGYAWGAGRDYNGYVTLPYDLPDGSCRGRPEADGVRAVAQETFVLRTVPGENLLLMTMLHSVMRGTYDVYVNDRQIDRNWIPETPGCWTIARTMIPAEMVTGDSLTVRIEAHTEAGVYQPAHHAVIVQDPVVFDADQALGHFQNEAFGLMHVEMLPNPGSVLFDMLWYVQSQAEGDYKLFVHVLDTDERIVAQTDRYVFHAPPGNWPPGVLSDTVVVNLNDVPPGTYYVALGFYNPYTNERLIPQSDVLEVRSDGRLFIGEVDIP